MTHLKENLVLIEEIDNFLKDRGKKCTQELWQWALRVPIEKRLDNLFTVLRMIEEEL